MEYIVSNQEIQNTNAYQKLEKIFQLMVLKLANKKTISHGLIVHSSTGVIPGSVAGNNRKILLELIENKKSLS